MKNLIMISMLMVFVSCNGAGGSSSPEPEMTGDEKNDVGGTTTTTHTDKIIEYNSNGVFQSNGVSMDQMGTFDQQRGFIIPETLDLVQDSNGSVQVGDLARITFVQSNCNYHWDGNHFLFQSCTGALVSAQHGDVIHLVDIQSVVNPQMNGIVQMGVIRPMNSNHTGTIIIKGNLQ